MVLSMGWRCQVESENSRFSWRYWDFDSPRANNLERVGVASMALMIDGCWYVFVAMMLVKTEAVDWLSKQGFWVDRLLGVLLVGVGTYYGLIDLTE